MDLYGDFSNWFGAFAFRVFKYYGYGEVVLLDGDRKKWLEEDRPVTKDIPNIPKGNYIAGESDSSLRAYLHYVKATLGSKVLVDVRSPKDFMINFGNRTRIRLPRKLDVFHRHRLIFD